MTKTLDRRQMLAISAAATMTPMVARAQAPDGTAAPATAPGPPAPHAAAAL